MVWKERVESIPDWFWEADLEGVITYSNRVVEDILGYTSSQVLHRPIFDFILPEDRDHCMDLFRKARETVQPITNISGKFATANSGFRVLQMSCTPYFDEQDRLLGFRGISRDITQQALEQNAARELQANYQALVEHSASGIFIVQNDRIVFANNTIAHQIGYEPEEVVGREVWDFVHPDDVGWLKDYHRRRLAGEDVPTYYVAKGVSRSGEVRYFDYRVTPIEYNAAPAVLLNTVDITEQVLAKHALQDSKDKYRNLVENTSDWVWEVDQDNIYTYASPRIRDLLGYEPEEVIGKTPYDLMLPSEAQRVRNAIASTMERHEPIKLLENTLLHKDGYLVMVETVATPVFDEAGEFRGYRGTDRDITERVKAEEALRESEERFRSLYEAVSVGVIVRDLDGVITDANRAAYEILELTPEQLLGQKSLTGKSLAIREDGSPFPLEEQPAMVTLRTGQPVHQVLMGIKRPDGRQWWLLLNTEPVADPQTGELKSVLTTFLDITDRKLAEQALQEERNYANALLDTVGALVVVLDREGRIVRFNRACEQITGYSFEEVRGEPLWDRLLRPKDIDRIKREFDRLKRRKSPSHFENCWVTKSGEERLIEWSNTTLTDREGTVTYVIGTGIDITARRAAQDALSEAEAKYRSLVEESLVGVYIVVDGRFDYVNPRFAHIFGYAPDEIQGIKSIEDLTAPESLPLVRENLKKRISGEIKSIHYSFKAVRKDGRIIDVEVMGSRTNFQGKPAVIGSLLDVTERRRAERIIRASEERFRLLFEHSPDMVCVLRNQTIIAANPAFQRTLGYEPQEIIGKSPWDISPEFQPDGISSKEKAIELMQRAEESGPIISEWLHQHKGGALVDCEVSLIGFRIHDESYTQAIIRDITERKQAEENQRRLERELESQKRLFYRETILSVTEGKLDIRDRSDIRSFISHSEKKIDVNRPAEVAGARHEVERFCRQSGLSGERLESFMIGVGEAITNAIKHGTRGRVYAGKGEDSVWVGISDRGKGIESLILPRATLLRGFSTKPSLGLGYSIMLDVADRILLHTGERGTIVVLEKRLKEPDLHISELDLPDTWGNIA